MGGSGKWLKSLITTRKPNMNDIEKVNDKGKKKWRLWRSSSEGFGSSLKNVKKGHEEMASEKSDSSFLVDEVFIAAMAAVVRAPPKDFMLIKKEWAAIRIQAAFRAFLARQALKALKAVVRLQAIFRGRQVRKQAAVTLRCMQALVRVQASVRARSATMSPCRQAAETLLKKHQDESDPLKQAERGWCDIPGTAEEVRAKLHMRQEAAIKREKIMAYSHSQKQSRISASPKSKTTKATSLLRHHSHDNSWLDSWIAAKPLGNRLLEKMHVGPREMSPMSRKSEDGYCTFYCPNDNYNVSRNNVTTRISANPLLPCQLTPSSSATSSDVMYDDSPASTSYTSASPSMMSSNTPTMETTEERNIQMPSYMNLTASTKAKKNAYRRSFNLDRIIIGDSNSKSTTILSGDARSSADSVCSINFRNNLHPSLRSGMKDSVRHQRRHQQK